MYVFIFISVLDAFVITETLPSIFNIAVAYGTAFYIADSVQHRILEVYSDGEMKMFNDSLISSFYCCWLFFVFSRFCSYTHWSAGNRWLFRWHSIVRSNFKPALWNIRNTKLLFYHRTWKQSYSHGSIWWTR